MMPARSRLVSVVSVLAAVLSCTPAVRAQAERDFTVLRDWTPWEHGGRPRAWSTPCGLTSEAIASPRVYADFILRFQYRATGAATPPS